MKDDTKPRVLINDKYHEKAVEELSMIADIDTEKISPEELVDKIGEYDAILIRSATKVTKEVMDAGKLKFVGRAGVGLDNVDLDHAKKKGIKVVNSPDASSVSVAEHAMALILSFVKNIAIADKTTKEGLWEKKKLKGSEIADKTLGLIGFGRIGKEVAKRANAFHMEVITYDPMFNKDEEELYDVKSVSLEDLYKQSDFISLHVPAVESTIKMINKDSLAMMKDNTVIINTARGKVIEEKDLINALKEGKIGGAGLDVYEKEPLEDSPLANMSNVILTPHIGANTEECQIKGGMIVVDALKKHFEL